jgi:quercetin dioxygenase-like cupin family protein
MKLLAATIMSLPLLSTALAQPNQPENAAMPSTSPMASNPDARTISITRGGTQPARSGPAEYFTGKVRVDPLFSAHDPSRTSGAYVTFEPGARSAWHTHPVGQTLVVTAGVGRVQRWGGQVEEMRVGDVVWIPPGLKHWHGASPGSTMTHIAIQEHLNGNRVTWMEKVSDSQYNEKP